MPPLLSLPLAFLQRHLQQRHPLRLRRSRWRRPPSGKLTPTIQCRQRRSLTPIPPANVGDNRSEDQGRSRAGKWISNIPLLGPVIDNARR